MKAEFYYKEEFPLELHLKVENLADLALINTIFYNLNSKDKGSYVTGWLHYMESINSKMYQKNPDLIGAELIRSNKKELQEEIDKVFEQIQEVYVDQREKEDERRNTLSGELA